MVSKTLLKSINFTLIKFLTQALYLISLIIFINTQKPDEYAKYAFIATMAFILSNFGDLGVLKKISSKKNKNIKINLIEILKKYQIILLIAFLIVYLRFKSISLLLFLFVIANLMLIYRILESVQYFYANNQVVAKASSIDRGIASILLYFSKNIYCAFISNIISMSISIIYLLKTSRNFISKIKNKTSLYFAFIDLLNVSIYSIPQLLAVFLFDLKDVGSFSAANSIIRGGILILISVANYIAFTVSKKYIHEEKQIFIEILSLIFVAEIFLFLLKNLLIKIFSIIVKYENFGIIFYYQVLLIPFAFLSIYLVNSLAINDLEIENAILKLLHLIILITFVVKSKNIVKMTENLVFVEIINVIILILIYIIILYENKNKSKTKIKS